MMPDGREVARIILDDLKVMNVDPRMLAGLDMNHVVARVLDQLELDGLDRSELVCTHFRCPRAHREVVVITRRPDHRSARVEGPRHLLEPPRP